MYYEVILDRLAVDEPFYHFLKYAYKQNAEEQIKRFIQRNKTNNICMWQINNESFKEAIKLSGIFTDFLYLKIYQRFITGLVWYVVQI